MTKLYLKKSSLYIAISTFIFCSIALFSLHVFIVRNLEEERTLLLNSSADIISLRIQNSLENRFSLVDALAAIYQTNPQIDEDTFIEITKVFIDQNLPIRALQISDKETYVKYTYPIKDNKAIYKKPIKLIDDSLRGEWVRQTITSKKKSIQPPFTLRQGGIGTIVRKAVFIDSTFIGLAIGVINLSDILNESIAKNEYEKFNIKLSDSNHNTFYQNRVIIDSNIIRREIHFPGTIWNMHLSECSTNTKDKNIPIILLWTFGFVFIVFILLFEILILNYNGQLKVTIKQKTDELIESQKRLNQIENLRTLGQLAGGIAHNFNNHLNTIIGFSELIKGDLSNVKKIKEYIQKIILTSKKSADLVSRITSFSRQGRYNEDEIDIHSIITLLSRHFSDDKINFILNLRSDKSRVYGDYNELNKALYNIFENSIEATEESGDIIINTVTINIDKNHQLVNLESLAPGEYIQINIEDNGKGMSEEVQSHLFEPFYTTKDKSFGAGMGLASVYGTIIEHDGFIDIHSALNKWTVVEIYLPAH